LLAFSLAVACSSSPALDHDAAAGDGADAGASTETAAPVEAKSCEPSDLTPCPPPGHATWRMPNPFSAGLPNPARLTATGGTAFDELTGLAWDVAVTAKVTWEDGLRHCQASTVGGHNDWRMPSRVELVSIMDFTRQPTIDPLAFPQTPDDYFWSSSIVPFDRSLAFSVYFGGGITAYGTREGASAHTRCVRGGRPGVSPRFEIRDETVRDLNTMLVWQRGTGPAPLGWETAKDYCDRLSLAGQSGWRLPSTKEMQTIVDETRHDPALDPAAFPNTPSEFFWTSTPVNKSGVNLAIYFSAKDGTTEELGVTENFYVRCVR
jgi:hypothetical protein